MAQEYEVEWRKLRADELRERARSDALVIVPVGSIEQHGPHLPVEVDSMLGETVALRTAKNLAPGGPVVVLPMLWTGLSEHHMSFGGTITLDVATFTAVIEGICTSIVRHGFRRIALLNGHGGNDNALRVCADELAPKLGVPIVQLTYWHAAAEPIAALLETQTSLRHACEAETSMMMALRPNLSPRIASRWWRAPTAPRSCANWSAAGFIAGARSAACRRPGSSATRPRQPDPRA